MRETEHATDNIPIIADSRGRRLIECDDVALLLRAIAGAAERIVDPEDAAGFAEAVRIEADNLEFRAITGRHG